MKHRQGKFTVAQEPDDQADEIAQRVREAGERARAEADLRRENTPPSPRGPVEIGGQKGLDPTRFGDWEKNGIVSDF